MTSIDVVKRHQTAIADALREIRDKYELAVKNKKKVSILEKFVYNEACLSIAKGWLNDGVSPEELALDRKREIKIRVKDLSKLSKEELVARLADFEVRAEQIKLKEYEEGDSLMEFYEGFYKKTMLKLLTDAGAREKKLGKFKPHTQNQKKAQQILVEMSKVKPLVKKDLQEFCKKMRANSDTSGIIPSSQTLRNYFYRYSKLTA